LTIAISIKINDGLVLASDSASTVLGQGPDGQLGVVNVYNNASKIFNLRKGFPIGAITWGAGSIGQASISTIIKDLRQAFTGKSKARPDLELKSHEYTVESVAHRLKEFVFDELYEPAFKSNSQKPDLGFIVAGYSANDDPMADEFQIEIKNGTCIGPTRLRPQDQSGLTAGGETEALNRLMLGTASELPQVLRDLLKVPQAQTPQVVQAIQQRLMIPLLLPAMPLQDAVDLGEFLVDLTIRFSRFQLGPPTVGGPVEIAAISKHEGFRWIRRKYYFDRAFNPEEEFTRTYKPDDKGIQE
jgi:hypothetical protein